MTSLSDNAAFLRGQDRSQSIKSRFGRLWKACVTFFILAIIFLPVSSFATQVIFLLVMVSGTLAGLVSIWSTYLEGKYELKSINLGPGEHGKCAGQSIGLRTECNHGASYNAGGGSFTKLCLCCCAKWQIVRSAAYPSMVSGIAIRRSFIPLHDGRCFDMPETSITILN